MKLIFSLLILTYSCSNPTVARPPNPPPPPTVFHGVMLTWRPSPTPSVNYRIYRGEAHDGPYTLLLPTTTGTAYIDINVVHGHVYYYIARSYNGLESANSNELKVTVP